MKKLIILCVLGFLTVGAFTAVYAEPLRKCNFYEIMNDEDDDGLVQDPKDGPSVCYYTQKDLSIAKKKAKKNKATSKEKTLIKAVTPTGAPEKRSTEPLPRN